MSARFSLPEARLVVSYVVAAGFLIASVAMFSAENVDITSEWPSALSLAAVGVVTLLRAARGGVLITDAEVRSRGVLYTEFAPWQHTRDLEFTADGSGLLMMVDGRSVAIRTGQWLDGVNFVDAVTQALTTAQDHPARNDRRPYPGRARLFAAALIPTLIVLVGASLGLDDAERDYERLHARARRDQVTVASVLRSRVDEGDGDEGDHTLVDVVFETDSGRRVETQIVRPDAWRFEVEQNVLVVYDAAHPRDADFTDQRSTGAEAADQRDVSLVLVVMSVAGLVVISVVMLVAAWRSRHPG